MSMQDQILYKLSEVADPETGLNVIRMGLIRDISFEEKTGEVHLAFRPTSFFCPMAFKLGVDIRDTVKGIAGVNKVDIKVENFARAKELNELLAQQ